VVGHFKKRGDKWYYWAELDRDADGRRRQVSKGGFRTRREAEKAFAAFRDQLRAGTYTTPSKATVESFLVEEWLPAVQANIRPATWEHYQIMARSYVVPPIGSLRLSDLQATHLNALYSELLLKGRAQAGPRRSLGLSPKTVRNIHTMLHKALSDAVKWDRIPRNPASRAEPPRAKTPEMKVWSAAQLRTFLECCEDDRLYAVWLLMCTTGMRRGEVAGLRWTDLDLDNSRLSVVQTIVAVEARAIISEPKTTRGRRSIALDAATVSALRSLRKTQLEERLRLGEFYEDTGLVVVHETGLPVSPRLLTMWFARMGADYGLPAIRLHDLRHSYATAALAAGVPAKIVSERLGHANIAITLDTYSHVLPNMQEQAAEQVAQLILHG
jgi:integrase